MTYFKGFDIENFKNSIKNTLLSRKRNSQVSQKKKLFEDIQLNNADIFKNFNSNQDRSILQNIKNIQQVRISKSMNRIHQS